MVPLPPALGAALLALFSTGPHKQSSPTLPPADSDDENPLRGLFVHTRDPTRPSWLLMAQPHLRPGSLLDSKLAEAPNLANSPEEPRDGFSHGDLANTGATPHLVVQNPASRVRSRRRVEAVPPWPY